MIFEIKGEIFEITVLNRNKLNRDLIQQWEDLEARSIEGNAYLSPNFILPAIKYLTPNAKIIFVFITHVAGNTKILTGLGVFEYLYGSKLYPFPHLSAYHCKHTYLTGLLVDEEFAGSTLTAFFKFIQNFKQFCHGVEFTRRTRDTRLANKIDITASQMNIPWYQNQCMKRVILLPRKLSSDCIDKILSSRTKKNMRYSRNVLSKKGEIGWKIFLGHDVDRKCIDRFLNMEHMGWKNTSGTSLLSKANDEAFFREMIAGFSSNGNVFFTELMVDGCAIASTSNLLSGKSGFAFKIGWDPAFAAASPGILNEVEFIKSAAEIFPHLEYIDSGAGEDSFIEKLWIDNYSLVSGFFSTKKITKLAAIFFDIVRRMKHSMK